MISEIVYHNDVSPKPTEFFNEARAVIEEWEEFTGRSTVFTLTVDIIDARLYCLYESALDDMYQPYPMLDLLQDGGIHAFYYSGRDVDTGQIKNISDIRKLSTTLGVKDILNPLPHEYGLLKLKHGIGRDWLFFPSMFRGEGIAALIVETSIPPHNDVVTQCESIISQWEDHSGDSTRFMLSDETKGFRVDSMDTRVGGADPTPEFVISEDGRLIEYCSTTEDLTLGINTDYNNISLVSEGLGVRNILSLEPHEYGYLKLKHGLTKNWLFFPTQLRSQCKEVV